MCSLSMPAGVTPADSSTPDMVTDMRATKKNMVTLTCCTDNNGMNIISKWCLLISDLLAEITLVVDLHSSLARDDRLLV